MKRDHCDRDSRVSRPSYLEQIRRFFPFETTHSSFSSSAQLNWDVNKVCSLRMKQSETTWKVLSWSVLTKERRQPRTIKGLRCFFESGCKLSIIILPSTLPNAVDQQPGSRCSLCTAGSNYCFPNLHMVKVHRKAAAYSRCPVSLKPCSGRKRWKVAHFT